MRLFYLILLTLCSLSPAFAQQKPISCGTSDEALPKAILDKMAQAPLLLQQQKARLAAGEMYICRIAIDIDYQTYLKLDGDTNLIYRKVMEDIQQVSEVYEREINTRMVVTNIRIFKSAASDPYGDTDNIFSLLSTLTSMSPAFSDYDKRAYFYTKPVTGNASGVAYLWGATSVSALGYPQLMMHEFGHNFGSPHTHNCSWPGGPIDYCSAIEGDCYDKAIEGLSDRSGTIMSYCSSDPTFHPLCQALMRDHAGVVFSKIDGVPAKPQLARETQVTRGDYLFWKASTAALSYEVMYASNSDFSEAKTVSVPFNGFNMKGFGGGNTLFVRIRAVNSFGTSDWSEATSVSVSNAALQAPEIVNAETPPILPMNVPITLSYPAVSGATSYEVQVAHAMENFFESLYFSTVTSASEIQYTPVYPGMMKWRVRAMNEGGAGKWSESVFFAVNTIQGYTLTLPFSGDAPTSFPFSYSAQTAFPRVRVTVAGNPEFNNPLFSREYKEYGGVLDVVPQLPANSQFYFRVEEWNETMTTFPKVKIADYTFPFKTGSNALSGLSFLPGVAPDVFNQPFPRIALTSQNLWVASSAKGFVRVNQKDLSYEIFNRANTDGLIGFAGITPSLQVDDSLKIHIMSYQANNYFRRVELPTDDPARHSPVGYFYFGDYISDYDPGSSIYWGQRAIYKEQNGTFLPVKIFNQDWSIRKVTIMSGKIWALTTNNWGYGEIVVMDMTGNELEKINYITHPDLLSTMEQFVVSPDGRMMIMQYDINTYSYRVSFWNKEKWTILSRWDAPVSGGQIQSIASAPSGDFYAMVSGEQTRILKHNGTAWEQVGKDIPLRNFAFNMAVDLNDNIWLTGQYGVAKLAIPQFDLTATGSTNYCAKDSITLMVNVGNKATAEKSFAAVLKKTGGEITTVTNLSLRDGQITFKTPASFTGRDIELQLKTVDPEMYAPTSLRINIHEMPTAKVSISKSELIPLLDTATVTVELTGEKPWIFLLSARDSIFTESPRYTAPFILTKQADFDLNVSMLVDKHCNTSEPSNTIRIKAMQITSTSEPQWPKVSVYPNPSAGKVLIEHEQQISKPVIYHLSDLTGTAVGSKQARERLTEWDISRLGAGTYMLWTVQNGNKRSWKIVKAP